MYSSKDISIVIVSYNRPQEIERNFVHLERMHSKPYEVLVVDQSEKTDTKRICQKHFKKIKNLRYLRSEKPSIAMAKNVGVRNASNHTSILLFLDDDAYVGPDYLDEITSAYNRLTDAVGIAGEESVSLNRFPKNRGFFFKMGFLLESYYKRLFFLGFIGDKYRRVTSPFGNTLPYTSDVDKLAQWFSGTDPSYKKFVFKDLKFDENFFGWSLGEDIDISYRIYKKYGPLYIVPSSLIHSHPQREWTEERKIKAIYMNQINHFYLFYKDMPEMRLRFIWNYIGIFVYRTFAILNFSKFKDNYREWRYLAKSFNYCLRNREKIKKGNLSLPI